MGGGNRLLAMWLFIGCPPLGINTEEFQSIRHLHINVVATKETEE